MNSHILPLPEILIAERAGSISALGVPPLVGLTTALWAAGGRCGTALARRDAPRLEVAHGGRLAHSDSRAYLLGGEALVDVQFD